MSNQTPQVDKCILSPPGGPAGPFWGVVKQRGRVVAMQIMMREDAEILRAVKNLMAGDFDTNRDVGRQLIKILGRDFELYDAGSEDYLVQAVSEAILGVVKESIE